MLWDKPIGLRRSLYKVARIMGDVNAVKNGMVGKRAARRAAGKAGGPVAPLKRPELF